MRRCAVSYLVILAMLAGNAVAGAGPLHRVCGVKNHGGAVFIDLRDRYGRTQVVFNPDSTADVLETVGELRNEFVIKVSGKIRQRPEGQANKKISIRGRDTCDSFFENQPGRGCGLDWHHIEKKM